MSPFNNQGKLRKWLASLAEDGTKLDVFVVDDNSEARIDRAGALPAVLATDCYTKRPLREIARIHEVATSRISRLP